MMSKYEVYVCKYKEDVLYVGQGKVGRSSHCNSGCSHVYGLNRLHFGKVDFTVDVVSLHETQKEALDEECRLISKLKPKFNKRNNDINSHYNLYNLTYLEHECNLHLKHINCRDELDSDDMEVYELQNFDYMTFANPLYFKKVNDFFLIDTERNISSNSWYNEQLVEHSNRLFYSKSEVVMFCYRLFIFGDDCSENSKWRYKKAGQDETLSLLTDIGCVIEYN